MNFVPNSKFYQSIFRLDPTTLAMAKSRINSNEETTKTSVIENESTDDVLFEKINKNSKTESKSSNFFSKDFFNLTFNSASYSEISNNSINTSKYNIENNDDSTKSSKMKNGIITALCEGRGNAMGEIGLVFIDLNTPILYLSQFSDDLLYTALITKLQIHTPTELLVPKTLLDSNYKSIDKIRKVFFDLKITTLPRRHFNQQDGVQMLLNYGLNQCQNEIKNYEKKYYAICATSALLKYLKVLHSVTFLSNGLVIKFDAKLDQMVLDYNTWERLELLQPIIQTKHNKACLLDILDRTVTQIGRRQIRAKILEPYLEIKDILFVQEAITELLKTKSKNVIGHITEILKKFYNVDKILKITFNDRIENDPVKSVQIMLDKILLLKGNLETIPELNNILKPFQSYILYKMNNNLLDERFNNMLKIIDKVLRPETHFIRGTAQSFQRIHAIRPGLNEYLDILRNTYNKYTDQINEIINKLAEHYGLPLRMTYSTSRGFHIQLVKSKKKTEHLVIPTDFVKINEKSNAIFLTTNEIVKINVKLRDTANEIFKCCDKIIKKLTEDLIQYNEANFLLVDTIANLDIIISYAKVSETDGFCCPEFGEETRIVDARHIFLENGRSNRTCIPNNIIGTPEYNVFIITGPNMAGKTIYLKTIALMQIIAQLGCYVPAKVAKFRICDKIFTRLGFTDKVEENGSGFINEMREMEYIFKNMTSRSLIIIDELCRTTNPSGGFNLAWKLCSKLCQFERVVENDKNDLEKEINFVTSQMPHIYISTHFIGLTKLKDKYFNVVNLQVEAEEIPDDDGLKLKYTHKVREGVTTIKNYGLNLAKCVGIPDEILKDAYNILNDIRMSSTKNDSKIFESINESIEEIDILQKLLDSSFPNKNFEIEKKDESFVSIANFMNNFNNDLYNTTISSTKKLVCSSEELLQEFCFKMYDFYAEIAALQRQSSLFKPEELQKKVQEIFENVKESLPEELQHLLSSKETLSIFEKNKIEKFETYLNSNTGNSSLSEMCCFNMVMDESKIDNDKNSYSLSTFENDSIHKILSFKFTTGYDNDTVHEMSFCSLPSNRNTLQYNLPDFKIDFKENFVDESKVENNSGKAKVIENIQIVPPHKYEINHSSHEINLDLKIAEDQSNILYRDTGTNTVQSNNLLNKSFDISLFKSFHDSKSFDIENKKINKTTVEDMNYLKVNKTFDLGDLKSIQMNNSIDLFEDTSDDKKN